MSKFDEAFGRADDAAFSDMETNVLVWSAETGPPVSVRAIVSPAVAGGNYRMGGKSETASLEVEFFATDVAVLGIEDGWRLQWGSRVYRINELTFQGYTVTSSCGPVAEALRQ